MPSFAYYCSGHGYGHATRVSAFTSHLLSLPKPPTIYIISSAPRHVFVDSLALGALYRYAEIDPVIVQPLAYRVDRQKSVDVLEAFFRQKDLKVAEEACWLAEKEIECVLSDTAFLGCLAANEAHLPSVLVTNFSFDSVYSYLATTLFDQSQDLSFNAFKSSEATHTPELHAHILSQLAPDIPIAPEMLEPLVAEIQAGFRCADLLLLLPGAIPMPSFGVAPGLPSPQWIDPATLTFHSDIVQHLSNLLSHPSPCHIHPSIPFPSVHASSRLAHVIRQPSRSRQRTIQPSPLLVRPPSATPSTSPYSPAGRARLLSSLGIPPALHDPEHVKILIVSFGGQTFRPPRSGSRTPRTPGHSRSPSGTSFVTPPLTSLPPITTDLSGISGISTLPTGGEFRLPRPPKRLTSSSHIFVPGAPPARSSSKSPVIATSPAFRMIPPTPDPQSVADFSSLLSPSSSLTDNISDAENIEEEPEGLVEPQLLPDDSWIAVVCGVPADWGKGGDDGEGGLPDGFYVAPRDVYMPDLTAAADVLLGKLGYGTVSECVDAATPFVYVSRPLFVEEHGLRLLLSRDGVGVELARSAYENGDWAMAVSEAYQKGCAAKAQKRLEETVAIELESREEVKDGIRSGAKKRAEEGRQMAESLMDWVEKWWEAAMAP